MLEAPSRAASQAQAPMQEPTGEDVQQANAP